MAEHGGQPGKSYDLIVVDVDGTLLDNEQAVTDEVHQVVAMARRAGVHLVLATGRVFCSAVQIAEELEMTGLMISDGGAIIHDLASGQTLRRLYIPKNRAVEILQAVACEDVDCHLFYATEILVNRRNAEIDRYAARLQVTMHPVPDLAAAASARKDGPTMIVLRTTRELAPLMRKHYQASVGDADVLITSSSPHFVDFVHPETSKARALDFLCSFLGIPAQRVIAIGDGINDLDMIAHAGLGVLVANADQELWEHADYVTSRPYYHGVAEVIERFCLK